MVVYNAARIKFGTFDQYSEEDIVTDFKIPCVGLYTSAKIKPTDRRASFIEATLAAQLNNAVATFKDVFGSSKKHQVHADDDNIPEDV